MKKIIWNRLSVLYPKDIKEEREKVLRQHRINAKNRIIQWVPNKNCE